VGLLPGCTEPEVEADPDPVVLVCPEREQCIDEFCEQVLIPEGEFNMGSDHGPHADSYWPSGDERPVHAVQLDTFCIDKYEVSLERYESCVDAGECVPEGGQWEGRRSAFETWVNHYPQECLDDMDSCSQRAVNGKTYWQAEAYCEWLGSRLCTEAEWERVANGPGPDQRQHPWGDEEPTAALANIRSTNAYATDGEGFVERVDICPDGVSVEGVYNMAGNVYEWVADAYTNYESTDDGEALENPTYPATSLEDDMVGRGACFFTEPEHTVSERSLFPLDFDWG